MRLKMANHRRVSGSAVWPKSGARPIEPFVQHLDAGDFGQVVFTPPGAATPGVPSYEPSAEHCYAPAVDGDHVRLNYTPTPVILKGDQAPARNRIANHSRRHCLERLFPMVCPRRFGQRQIDCDRNPERDLDCNDDQDRSGGFLFRGHPVSEIARRIDVNAAIRGAKL